MSRQLDFLAIRYELDPNVRLVASAIEHCASGGSVSVKDTYVRDLMFVGHGVLAVHTRAAESLAAHAEKVVEGRIGSVDWRLNEILPEDFYA